MNHFITRHTLSVLVENTPGVLSQVSRLFSRKGYNIESIVSGETSQPGLTRITIVILGDELMVNQIAAQCRKLIPVQVVKILDEETSIQREFAMIKVMAVDRTTRDEIIQMANIFRANIIDVSRETLTVAIFGDKSKTGALMVFERSNRLDSALKTGTALDAEVNSELLKNIFWNKAPLHDGAVIVREGRIVGAGCMLPLSGNVNLSRDLGMRHRAGIGMSEHSDAVVVIVSEETGSISAAMGGMLKRHLAPETLERLLRNELMPEPVQDDSAAKFKLGSLLRFVKGDKQDGKEDS